MASSHMPRSASMVFRPPPGLTLDVNKDVPLPPGLELPRMTSQGSCAHEMRAISEQWSSERPRCKLSILAAISSPESFSAPLKVYPSKPPGTFGQHCDTCSATSTTASELSEDSDDNIEIPTLVSSLIASKPMEEAHKGFSRELRIEPFDTANNRPLRISWPVDSRRLRCKDKQIVSPAFEVYPGCSFKLMLKPKTTGDRKHQEGFHSARGWGSVELKCVEGSSLAPTLRFSISVGGGAPRGPVAHNFSENTVSRLMQSEESFDFASAVNKKTSMFSVCMQAFPIKLPEQTLQLD